MLVKCCKQIDEHWTQMQKHTFFAAGPFNRFNLAVHVQWINGNFEQFAGRVLCTREWMLGDGAMHELHLLLVYIYTISGRTDRYKAEKVLVVRIRNGEKWNSKKKTKAKGKNQIWNPLRIRIPMKLSVNWFADIIPSQVSMSANNGTK